jgi:DNA-binding MarR family transcriptional regulator
MLQLNEKQKKFEHIVEELSNNNLIYYLLTGDTQEEKYQTEYKIMYRLINLRYDEQTIEQFFKAFAGKNTHFRNSKIATFRSSLQNAKVYYNNHKSKFDYECDTILEHVDYFTALSVYERITLKTILRTAKKIGRFDHIDFALKEAARRSGITFPSVNNNLKKLVDKGILIKVKKSEKRKPTIYSINKDSLLKSIVTKGLKTTNELFKSHVNNINSKDFDRKNLGKQSYLILNYLTENPNSEFDTYKISETLGMSFPTAKKHVEGLEEYGYIVSRKTKTNGRPKKLYKLKK